MGLNRSLWVCKPIIAEDADGQWNQKYQIGDKVARKRPRGAAR